MLWVLLCHQPHCCTALTRAPRLMQAPARTQGSESQAAAPTQRPPSRRPSRAGPASPAPPARPPARSPAAARRAARRPGLRAAPAAVTLHCEGLPWLHLATHPHLHCAGMATLLNPQWHWTGVTLRCAAPGASRRPGRRGCHPTRAAAPGWRQTWTCAAVTAALQQRRRAA